MPTVLTSFWLMIGCDTLPTARRSTEIITFDQAGSLTVLRWSQGDTGWMKGQGHFRANWWSQSQTPLMFWDHAPTEYIQWQENERSLGLRHQVTYENHTWTANSHFDEWNLRLLNHCDAENIWSNDLPNWHTNIACISSNSVGWLQSYKQSHPIQGWSVVINHEGTRTHQKHLQIMGMSSTHYLYATSIDEHIGGILVNRSDNSTIPIDAIEHSTQLVEITIGSTRSTIPMDTLVGIDDPYEHLASWERYFAASLSTSSIAWYRATAVVNESPMALIIRQQGE